MDTITIRIDGVDYEIPKAAAPHIQKALADREERIKALEGERDKLEGRADALDKDLQKAKDDLEQATDPAQIQKRVDARTELERAARTVLGSEAKLDGKTDREIKEAVIVEAAGGELKLDDKSDGYVEGRFEAAIAVAADGDKSRARSSENKQRAREAVRGDNKPAAKPPAPLNPNRFAHSWAVNKDRAS